MSIVGSSVPCERLFSIAGVTFERITITDATAAGYKCIQKKYGCSKKVL
ncbi:hypothetical protein TNCV_4008131 [Trichonephila clavipes]|nr:hypothetical protein TNCV_4008131 [Trichonephila clavipes]